MDELLASLKLRLRCDESTNDALLTDYLNGAVEVINGIRDYVPTDDEPVIEARYKRLAVSMALVSYNRSGAEGESSHDENGLNRTYETGEYPISLINKIVPKARLS